MGPGDDPRGHKDYHSMDDPSSLRLFTKSHRAATRLARNHAYARCTWAQLSERLRVSHVVLGKKCAGLIDKLRLSKRANFCFSTSRVIYSRSRAKPRELASDKNKIRNEGDSLVELTKHLVKYEREMWFMLSSEVWSMLREFCLI